MDILHQYKKDIDTFLTSFLSSKEKDFSRVNPWGTVALEKIMGIISDGKTIRGSLVLLCHDMFGGKNKQDALRVAAAYELVQTGFLIHDDIMDHDSIRRGKPAMHIQLKSEGLAICVGDILFFLANELLDHTPVQTISAHIFQEVSIAQMEDVAQTATTKKTIASLYTHKTARYTFSLPMMAGAILAGADRQIINLLEKLGEDIGILFQIHDDRIDNDNNPFTDSDINTYRMSAEKLILRLPIQRRYKKNLQDLLHFVLTRQS